MCIISSTPPTLFHINKSLVFDFLEPTWTFMRRCAENHQVRPKRGLCYYHQLLLTEINCGSPGILPNGWLEGQKTTLHAVVTFRCQEGMTFEGPSYRTICLADGRWSHPLPRCYGKTRAFFFKHSLVFHESLGMFPFQLPALFHISRMASWPTEPRGLAFLIRRPSMCDVCRNSKRPTILHRSAKTARGHPFLSAYQVSRE